MALRLKLLNAIAEVHSGNGLEGKAILDAILTKLEAEGLVIRPKVATDEIARSGFKALESVFSEGLEPNYDDWKKAYAGMISAHPNPLGVSTDEA